MRATNGSSFSIMNILKPSITFWAKLQCNFPRTMALKQDSSTTIQPVYSAFDHIIAILTSIKSHPILLNITNTCIKIMDIRWHDIKSNQE